MVFRLLKNFCGASCFSLIAFIHAASATVSVTPLEPYTFQGSTLYMGGNLGATAPVDGIIDTYTGFQYLNLSSTGETVILDVTSSSTSFTGAAAATPLVMVVYAEGAGTYKAIPLTGAQAGLTSGDPAACGASSHACETTSLVTPVATSYYLSAAYTVGQTLRIALSPALICQYASDAGATVTGCTAGAVTAPTDAVPVSFNLAFVFGVVDGAGIANKAGAENDESAALTFRFQKEGTYVGTDLTCQAGPVYPFYFPGDTEILVYPERVNVVATTTTTGGAPVATIVMMANAETVAATAADWNNRTNTINSRFSKNVSSHSVTGFVNATDYSAAFSIQDAAGIIAGTAGAFPGGNCSYDATGGSFGITTSAVEGFLAESQCFVATAAFGDGHAAPVEFLRNFRDQVLIKTSIGRAFVGLYYKEGPIAAKFLLKHPWLRAPVVFVLAPISALAWLILHPSVMISSVILVCALFFGRRKRLRTA